MALKVIFFVEGGKAQGYGHLARCRALADTFAKAGHTTRFLVRGDSTANAVLEKESYILTDWLKETPPQCDIAVVDSYAPEYDDCARIAAHARKTVFFDDINRISYPPGIILNGTLTAENIEYARKQGQFYLLGPKYQLLRPQFLGVKKENIPDKPKSVMVTFGGNDLRDLSPLTIKTLVENFPDLEKNIVIGKSYTNGPELAEEIDSKTLFFYAPGAEEMAQLMQLSDFAICAGGQTLFELAAIGTPAVVIGIADNQEENIKGWLKHNFITFAGWHDDEDLRVNLLHAVNAMLAPGAIKEKAGKGFSLINPSAADDIAEVILSELNN
ncbi:MAG: hypothetical protein WCS77_03835 [Elusimicrobiaceae bacterium]